MSLASQLVAQCRRSQGAIVSGETLKAKVFRGGVWLGTGSFIEQLTRFARNMILARILAPEAFGTMAIVLSAGSVIDTLTEIGVREAVIQNAKGEEREYLNAAWWLALARGLPLYAFVFCLAPSLAKFYGNPELAPLLRVTLLSILFFSLISPGVYRALKQMKFQKWAAINHGGGICGVLITVALSLVIRNVWALVIGYAFEGLARCLLSYIICPYLPSLEWDRNAVRELLQFSKGLFGLSLLNLIFARSDIFVLAKLYPAAQLGLYTMAIYLAQTPTGFVMNMLGQTLLPTYANVRADDARVNRILLQVTSAVVLLGMPALTFVFFCGHSLLTLSYGERYAAASNALFIAASVAIVNLLNAQITLVFYAKGKPQLHRRCVGVMAFLMIIVIYPFARSFGLVGGQLACLLAVTVGYLFQLDRIHRLTGLSLGRYGRSFLYGVVASLAVVLGSLSARISPGLARPVPTLIFGISGCLLAYGLCAVFFLRKRPEALPN
jgi:lipopolysaccharide exporter